MITSTRTRERGFTLVELMIVVVIVAILAAVAIPSWRNHVIDTGRTAAVADLNELTLFMERQFTAQGRYDDAGNAGNLANALPFTTSPQGDPTARYNLSLAALNATSYTLRATPTGGQTEDTTCGELRVDQTGTQCILAGTTCSTSGNQADRDAVANCF